MYVFRFRAFAVVAVVNIVLFPEGCTSQRYPSAPRFSALSTALFAPLLLHKTHPPRPAHARLFRPARPLVPNRTLYSAADISMHA
jgi:hypothetical protein